MFRWQSKMWMKNKKKQCYTKLVKVATRQKLKIKKEYLS